MDETDWLDVTIARKWNEAVGIAAFELVPAGGGLLPAFDAGAYVDVLTPSGHLRSYSLCNSPTERHRYVIAVLREHSGRGGSIDLHKRTRPGDRLRIRAPLNEFPISTTAVYSVLLGGGIGVTPLLGMADTLWRRGAGFELHYSARTRERAAFDGLLQMCSFAARVRRHWSEHGRIGFEQVLARVPVLSHLYVCGPDSFVDSAVSAARESGWPLERLHLELFGPLQRLAP